MLKSGSKTLSAPGRARRRLKRIQGAHKLAAANATMSRRVDMLRQQENQPVLKVENGVAVNLDYNNPSHSRWLED